MMNDEKELTEKPEYGQADDPQAAGCDEPSIWY